MTKRKTKAADESEKGRVFSHYVAEKGGTLANGTDFAPGNIFKEGDLSDDELKLLFQMDALSPVEVEEK